jgi:hypothetical protein
MTTTVASTSFSLTLEWDVDDLGCASTKEGCRTYCHPDYFKPIAPLVYHNEGNGHFTEVSQKIGLAKPGEGLGIAYRRLHRMDETKKVLRRYQAQQDSAGTAPTSPPTDPPADPK